MFPEAEQLSVAVALEPLQVITGDVRSLFVIRCLQEAVLPQASVAVQVRVMFVIHPILDVAPVYYIVTEEQLSVAMADPPVFTGITEALHSITMSGGQKVNTGAA